MVTKFSPGENAESAVFPGVLKGVFPVTSRGESAAMTTLPTGRDHLTLSPITNSRPPAGFRYQRVKGRVPFHVAFCSVLHGPRALRARKRRPTVRLQQDFTNMRMPVRVEPLTSQPPRRHDTKTKAQNIVRIRRLFLRCRSRPSRVADHVLRKLFDSTSRVEESFSLTLPFISGIGCPAWTIWILMEYPHDLSNRRTRCRLRTLTSSS